MEEVARGAGGEAENQYEITLARASAKLQVIKRADKQMKQREARGAASPSKGRGKRGNADDQEEDDGPGEERKPRPCAAKQILRSAQPANPVQRMKKDQRPPNQAFVGRHFRDRPIQRWATMLVRSSRGWTDLGILLSITDYVLPGEIRVISGFFNF